MLYSKLFGKSTKDIIKFDSRNHELLIKAGFIDQVASGIYSFLPLGKRTLSKIENIIREELNNIEAQEIQMPLLHPKALWDVTNRWNNVDVLFKTKTNYGEAEYALAPTHEETITSLAKKNIKSYRDLPLSVYHITEKFRDEARAKSGILRGREFGMNDLYSFHSTHQDFLEYYEKVKKTYLKIFARCGIKNVKISEASGGDFSKKTSHEFNVITPAGEVDLIHCNSCEFAQNIEVSKNKKGDTCPNCKKGTLEVNKAIEIGNIFDLGTRFTQDFNLTFKNEESQDQYPIMGCYGIGTSRLLGAIVEVLNDNDGILWPKEITPFHIHLVNLSKDKSFADLIYRSLIKDKIEVLYDDRENISAGEKLKTSDLIGIPLRLIVSDKTHDRVEYKFRNDINPKLADYSQIKELTKEYYFL